MSDDKLRIWHDGNGQVLYTFRGKVVFDSPVRWEIADLIARNSTRAARAAEEHCKANQIIYDNALLHRSGRMPFLGLSDHPLIKDETIKEALHNRELRRALPYQRHSTGIGNIKSKGIVGTPTISKQG